MSYSDYLWTVARALRERVHADVATDEGRETVQNCVRVLTALANALERDAPAGVPRPGVASDDVLHCVVREAMGPPENPALHLATEAVIADVAARIDRGLLTEPTIVRDLARWEHQLQTEAVRRMSTVEAAAPVTVQHQQIDRDRLQGFLRSRTGSATLVVEDFRPALGGRSRQTALFTINGGGEIPRRLVVQRALPGMAKSAAFCGPEVEFKVLDTLHRAGLKVPRPLFLESDSSVLGGPFVVVEQSPGRLVQGDYWAPPDSATVALQLASQMAKLHVQPLEPLASVLPHSRESGDRGAWLNEIERFAALWRAQSHGPSITMSATLAWLRANVDAVEDRRALVHNDMVFHNILADDGTITAILDWEQASVGHPAEDLGYCYPVVSAVVDWQQFMDAYRDAGGAPMSQREIDYFSLRAVVRLMTLVQQGRHAFESRATDDVLVAGAGAFFCQRLLHRQSQVLTSILDRS